MSKKKKQLRMEQKNKIKWNKGIVKVKITKRKTEKHNTQHKHKTGVQNSLLRIWLPSIKSISVNSSSFLVEGVFGLQA